MESAICQVQSGNQFPKLSILKSKNGASFPVSCFLPVQKNQPSFQQDGKRVLGVKCGKVVSSSVDKILMEHELNLEEEKIEMKELINEKCKQGDDDEDDDDVGIVELLECLEREAIMGEDKGRDPNDYNRRALIFDKSSRVFQALKQVVQNNPAV